MILLKGSALQTGPFGEHTHLTAQAAAENAPHYVPDRAPPDRSGLTTLAKTISERRKIRTASSRSEALISPRGIGTLKEMAQLLGGGAKA